MRPTTKSLIAAAFLVGLSAQAQAQTIRLTATLSGGDEAPTPAPDRRHRHGRGVREHGHQGGDLHHQGLQPAERGHGRSLPRRRSAGVAGPVVVDLAPPQNISNDFTLTGTATAATLRPQAAIRASATGTTSSSRWSAARCTSTSTPP